MSIKQKIENNLALSLISICIVAFGLGFTANETIIKTSNLEKIDSDLLHRLKVENNKISSLQVKYNSLIEENNQLRNRQVKVHIVDESGDDSERVRDIAADFNLINFIDESAKLTTKDTLKGFSRIDDNISSLIIHRHAIQDTLDDLTIELMKRYQDVNPKIQIIIYSSSFATKNEFWTNNYMDKLVDNGINIEKDNLIYYPRKKSNTQLISRYRILMAVLSKHR